MAISNIRHIVVALFYLMDLDIDLLLINPIAFTHPICGLLLRGMGWQLCSALSLRPEVYINPTRLSSFLRDVLPERFVILRLLESLLSEYIRGIS